jgi:hypothetical protein
LVNENFCDTVVCPLCLPVPESTALDERCIRSPVIPSIFPDIPIVEQIDAVYEEEDLLFRTWATRMQTGVDLVNLYGLGYITKVINCDTPDHFLPIHIDLPDGARQICYFHCINLTDADRFHYRLDNVVRHANVLTVYLNDMPSGVYEIAVGYIPEPECSRSNEGLVGSFKFGIEFGSGFGRTLVPAEILHRNSRVVGVDRLQDYQIERQRMLNVLHRLNSSAYTSDGLRSEFVCADFLTADFWSIPAASNIQGLDYVNLGMMRTICHVLTMKNLIVFLNRLSSKIMSGGSVIFDIPLVGMSPDVNMFYEILYQRHQLMLLKFMAAVRLINKRINEFNLSHGFPVISRCEFENSKIIFDVPGTTRTGYTRGVFSQDDLLSIEESTPFSISHQHTVDIPVSSAEIDAWCGANSIGTYVEKVRIRMLLLKFIQDGFEDKSTLSEQDLQLAQKFWRLFERAKNANLTVELCDEWLEAEFYCPGDLLDLLYQKAVFKQTYVKLEKA